MHYRPQNINVKELAEQFGIRPLEGVRKYEATGQYGEAVDAYSSYIEYGLKNNDVPETIIAVEGLQRVSQHRRERDHTKSFDIREAWQELQIPTDPLERDIVVDDLAMRMWEIRAPIVIEVSSGGLFHAVKHLHEVGPFEPDHSGATQTIALAERRANIQRARADAENQEPKAVGRTARLCQGFLDHLD